MSLRGFKFSAVLVDRCVCVCSLCGHYMSRGYRVLETRYPRGSTWHFCPGRFVKKPLTRVSKTRVLLESRVLETRDAIIINSSRNGQLTILLEKHCYLARGFPFCYLLPSFSFLSIYVFSLSLFLFFLYFFFLIYNHCSSPVSHQHHSNWWLSFVSYHYLLSQLKTHNRVVHFPLWYSSSSCYHAHQDSEFC